MIALVVSQALAVEPLQPDWPLPINDHHPRGMLLVDQLEVRMPGVPGSAATDIEGWYGGDRNRLRYRAEGVELQVGLGAEAQNESGAGWESRVEIGLEAVIPYDFDVELFIRVSHRGRVSSRMTAIKELRISQRLIVQGRLEATAAVQTSDALDSAAGLENAAAGLRVRYEFRRELAPYLGARWTGGMAPPTAQRFQSQLQAMGGLRVWW